jgi:hypothetical protein
MDWINASYLDFYKSRIFRSGTTEQERISNNLNRDFNQLVERSPDSVNITYNGVQYDCILNSGNSRIGAQTEKKVIQYLLTDLNLKLPEGAVFTMYQPLEEETTTWLCLHREIHSYYGYYKFKIIELDYNVKYVNNYGVIKTVPAYINGTGEFDIKEYFRYSLNTIEEVPYRALNLIWAANEEIKTDVRIMVGDEVWRVVDSDKISINGVYYTTLFKTTLNSLTDNAITKVADSDNVDNFIIYSNYGLENIASIDINTTNLSFYCKKNEKIVNGNFTYSNYDNTIISVVEDMITPITTGTTSMTVTETNSNIEKMFTINIAASINNYCYIIGNDYIPIDDTMIWTINSDLTISSISISEQLISYSLQNNILTINSLDKIGTTIINFYSGSTLLCQKELKIKSPWVS